MSSIIDRLKIVFLGLFAVGVVVVWVYQIFWVWPAKRCEGQQAWWDPATRTCATPLYIPDLTGRPAGMSREEWSKKQAARKVMSETYGPEAPPPAVKVEGKAAEAPKPPVAPEQKPAGPPPKK